MAMHAVVIIMFLILEVLQRRQCFDTFRCGFIGGSSHILKFSLDVLRTIFFRMRLIVTIVINVTIVIIRPMPWRPWAMATMSSQSRQELFLIHLLSWASRYDCPIDLIASTLLTPMEIFTRNMTHGIATCCNTTLCIYICVSLTSVIWSNPRRHSPSGLTNDTGFWLTVSCSHIFSNQCSASRHSCISVLEILLMGITPLAPVPFPFFVLSISHW